MLIGIEGCSGGDGGGGGGGGGETNPWGLFEVTIGGVQAVKMY